MKWTDEKISKLLHELKNCSFNGIKFQKCSKETGTAGGFHSGSNSVQICENMPEMMMISTIRHELVHALDFCKGNLGIAAGGSHSSPCRLATCREIAQSEVRASHLSGDCSFLQEILRAQIRLDLDWFRKCVKRRAIKSVAMHSRCKDEASAVVCEVFEESLSNTFPF
jgi:inner membrane protease ATP23